jgi:antagonist of KipI
MCYCRKDTWQVLTETVILPGMEKMYDLCETAVVMAWPPAIDPAHLRAISGVQAILQRQPFPGMCEMVPAYATLTIFFNPAQLPAHWPNPAVDIGHYIAQLLDQTGDTALPAGNTITIPVCYDDTFGPDLEAVAALHQCSKAEVVRRHTARDYTVFMVGFLPGFTYLGGLDPKIATPRRSSPRLRVAAGSVGIAGEQTGVYPLDAPGGWQIIGRTPLPVYRPGVLQRPFLLKTGDTVRFYPISPAAFARIIPGPAATASADQRRTSAPAAEITRSGPLATLQDLGRPGYRAYGVPVSGALDAPAHRLANALVGNAPEAATIECTMGGLSITFFTNAVLAVTGGGAALVNQRPAEHGRVIQLQKNDVLTVDFHPRGMRTYIAVRGGWDAPDYMGSKSTCRNAQLGDILQKGNLLRIGRAENGPIRPLLSPATPLLDDEKNGILRVIPGPEFDRLTPESQRQFYQQTYTIGHRSDRMGSRLESAPLALSDPSELLSTAVAPGTIQRTPDGQLILLLNDCQTTGGYPRVGQLAAVDLPRLAQLPPGATLQFAPITHQRARFLLKENVCTF